MSSGVRLDSVLEEKKVCIRQWKTPTPQTQCPGRFTSPKIHWSPYIAGKLYSTVHFLECTLDCPAECSITIRTHGKGHRQCCENALHFIRDESCRIADTQRFDRANSQLPQISKSF